MVKRAHHRSAVRHVLVGTIGTLGALAVSTQVASANKVIVKAGDTVWKIAQDHHATVSAIENANANTIKKVSDSVDLICAGQQLTLPGNDTTMQADENGRYTVQPGDTLSKIAQNFHVSVATLMAWNGLTSNQLYIGQQLIVNGQGVTVTPATSAVSAQAPVTNAAPVDAAQVTSVAPEADQETTTVVTASQTPVQSASADQQGSVTATNMASFNGNNAVTSTVSAAPTSAVSASTDPQMAEAATTNSDNGVVASQANTTASASTETSEAAAFATSTASATDNSTLTSTATDSVAPVSTATTTPVSSVTSAASASVAPAPTTPASTTTAPQPVASQAVTSANQAPVSQVASQAPVQSQAAATTTPAQPQSSASQDLHSGSVVSLAVKIANTNSVPYVWGGSSLSGMDCSGLVDYVYANAEGKQLPHNTVALENCVNQHSVSEAQPGDILFWGQHGATYHCAIYTGNNQFVAAAKPGTNVASYTVSPYFEPSFAGTVK